MELNLRKGTFFTAGSLYNFEGEGIGIRMNRLEKSAFAGEILRVIDKENIYEIEAYKALALVQKYQSYKRVRWNTVLGIVPLNAFTIRNIDKPIVDDSKRILKLL